MSDFLELCKEKGYGFDAKVIDVSCSGLTSLDGIELFTELEVLYCNDNQLISLDLSKNTALTELVCYKNQLTSLDVSNNISLRKLNCYKNQLTSLDVSMNTVLALVALACSNNKHPYTPIFYSLERIKIGCEVNTFQFWDNFFLGNCTIEFETKRGTPEFAALIQMWIEFKKELGL